MADIGDIILGGNKPAIALQDPAQTLGRWQQLTNAQLDAANQALQFKKGNADLDNEQHQRSLQNFAQVLVAPDKDKPDVAQRLLDDGVRRGWMTPEERTHYQGVIDDARRTGNMTNISQLAIGGIVGRLSGIDQAQTIFKHQRSDTGTKLVDTVGPGILGAPDMPTRITAWQPKEPSLADQNQMVETKNPDGSIRQDRNVNSPNLGPMHEGSDSGPPVIHQGPGIPEPQVPQIGQPQAQPQAQPQQPGRPAARPRSSIPPGPVVGPQPAPNGGWSMSQADAQNLFDGVANAEIAQAQSPNGRLAQSQAPNGQLAQVLAPGVQQASLRSQAPDSQAPDSQQFGMGGLNQPQRPSSADTALALLPQQQGQGTRVDPRVTGRNMDNRNAFAKEYETYSDPNTGLQITGQRIDRAAALVNKVTTGPGSEPVYQISNFISTLNGLTGGHISENDIKAGNFDELKKDLANLVNNSPTKAASVAALDAAFRGSPEQIKNRLANGTILAVLAGANRQAQIAIQMQREKDPNNIGDGWDDTKAKASELDPRALAFNLMTPSARDEYAKSIANNKGARDNFYESLRLAEQYGAAKGWTTPVDWSRTMGGTAQPNSVIPPGLQDWGRKHLPFGNLIPPAHPLN